jgi:apolipoprotein D and lipocalin family protein
MLPSTSTPFFGGACAVVGVDGAFTRRRALSRRRRRGHGMAKIGFIVAAVLAAGAVAALAYAALPRRTTIPAVSHVDLPRFAGDWFVIATIPTWTERDAYNAVESYALGPDGRIDTTFRYRDGGFLGPLKTLHPTATVRADTGNAVWDMRFVWPARAEYVIAWLAPDYSQTLIARSARDYAWLMARTPHIDEHDMAAAMARLRDLGYDTAKVRRVPQQWTTAAAPAAAP